MNLNPGYSFTLTIPPEKKVYYSGKRRAYKSLTQKQQWYFLNDLLKKCIWVAHFEFIDYVFETHEDGRLHIHGYAIPDNMFKEYGVLEILLDSFYTLHQIIGIKPSVYRQISNIQKTILNKEFWFEYIAKEQDRIIFKSTYQHQQDDIKQLDNGVVKIETRPTSPPPGYYDTYRFTGEKNKFFVNF